MSFLKMVSEPINCLY